MILPQSFYARSALQVARDLLGCFLVRQFPSGTVKFMITETEAYEGPRDKASHASRGRTERNAVMFCQPGLIYVYFTYGMHYLLNIVTGPIGYPAAVLIRAVEPEPSRRAHRGAGTLDCATPRLDGPAKLTKILGINKSFYGSPVYVKKYGLWIEGRKNKFKPPKIIRAPRVGIDYAGDYKDKKWRFYLKINR